MVTTHVDCQRQLGGDQRRLGGGQLRRIVAAAACALIVSISGATIAAVDNLVDHGGLVLTNPKLYIVYWGTDWQTGFTDAISGLPSATYQAYLEDYLNGVGGGRWLATQSQYRNAGSQPGVVKGKWVDVGNSLPVTPSKGQIEEEVRRAVNHFNNESEYPQAVYLIALPPGHGDALFSGKGGTACAWHSYAWNNNIVDQKFFPYITQPYMPDVTKGCAMNSVNKGFDFTGHGIFDGVSTVVGHEWAEVITDAHLNAWYGTGDKGLEAETGDKCTSAPRANIGIGGTYYAVQPLWSNNDGRCVMDGVPTADQSPASLSFVGVRYSSSSPVTVQLSNNGDLDLPLDLINKSPWYLLGPNADDFILSNQTCGKTLHPGDSCQVNVTFRPLEFGTRSSTLGVRLPFGMTITGNVTTLSGEGIPQWMQADNGIVVFTDPVFIGSMARASVHIANTDSSPKLIQRVMVGGPDAAEFSIPTDGCSDRTLAPGQSCMVVMGFAPRATGERRAELMITTGSGELFGLPTVGTGLGPVADVSPTTLTFDDIAYDSAGVVSGGEIPVSGELQKPITITNTGQQPLQVQRIEVTDDFILADNGCSRALLPNESCVIQVRLVPTHYQMQSGRVLIHDNTNESPHEVELLGSIDAALVALVPDDLQFGSIPVGVTSDPQRVELENVEGEAALNIRSIEATGDFTVASTDCPSVLLIGRCSIMVTLTPTAEGRREGMLVVTDDAPGGPRQIPLAGVGTVAPAAAIQRRLR